MMTREEHLAWCKRRALQYIDRGEIAEGLKSMISDMEKHPQTSCPELHTLTVGLMAIGDLDTVDKARRHVEGYR
jgi:hypothetical protein